MSSLEEYVVCPYDSSHHLRISRLAVHLERCCRNFPSSKLVRCPFNTTHVYSVADMNKHVKDCPNRSTLVHFMNPDHIASPKVPEPRQFVVESTENWDNEPPAPTYDPQAHCDNAFVIRNPQGAPPAARREFRQRERQRFVENDQF